MPRDAAERVAGLHQIRKVEREGRGRGARDQSRGRYVEHLARVDEVRVAQSVGLGQRPDAHAVGARDGGKRFARAHGAEYLAAPGHDIAPAQQAQHLPRVYAVGIGYVVERAYLAYRDVKAAGDARERVARADDVVYCAALVAARGGSVRRGQRRAGGQRAAREPVQIHARGYAGYPAGVGVLKAGPFAPARVGLGALHAVVGHPERVALKGREQVVARARGRCVYHGPDAGERLHALQKGQAYGREARGLHAARARHVARRTRFHAACAYRASKVFGLRARGGLVRGVHVVVCAHGQAGPVRALVVALKVGVDEVRALAGLYVTKLHARAAHALPVDVALPAAHVYAAQVVPGG